MEKIVEISEILSFYELTNKLKTTIDDTINNYSVADSIFGSMILAVAIDSEYKETNDLAKVLRMLFLNEFKMLKLGYQYSNSAFGKQIKSEVRELSSFKTIESKLVIKYKKLDFLLTNLIAKSNNDINFSELFEQAKGIFKSVGNTNEINNKKIFQFYYLNFKLKNKERSGWDSTHWNIKTDRLERISEHIVGTIGIAIAMQSELGYDIDFDKVIKMLAIHETDETLIGDITPFDGITPEKKKEIEHEAMIKALENLENKDKLLEILFEFDEKKTKEAKFAFYCDKIDADLQAKLYQDKGLHHSLDDQDNNCVFKSSKVKKMVENGATTAFDIWYGWDKSIYENDQDFPEFFAMLNFARDNDLLKLDSFVVKEKIFLTKEEHAILLDKSVNVINNLYNDKNVDSVYLTSYQSKNEQRGILRYMIVLNNAANYSEYSNLIETINKELNNINEIGISIVFDINYVNKYTDIFLHPSKKYLIEDLTESSIIFDKKRLITEVRNELKECYNSNPLYLIDYVPPIDKDVILKLKKIKTL